MSHATHRARLHGRFENAGKRAFDESGKHPVNERDEETSTV
jgi:hypothetical protein